MPTITCAAMQRLAWHATGSSRPPPTVPAVTEGLPRGLLQTGFTPPFAPASRNPLTMRHAPRATASTVLADPVAIAAFEPLAQMSTGAPSLARLPSGRLLLVHERRPPKKGDPALILQVHFSRPKRLLHQHRTLHFRKRDLALICEVPLTPNHWWSMPSGTAAIWPVAAGA